MIARLRELLEKATPGEWTVASLGTINFVQAPHNNGHIAVMHNDAELIAAAHNALPILIECAEALAYAYSVGQIVGGSQEQARTALAKLEGK